MPGSTLTCCSCSSASTSTPLPQHSAVTVPKAWSVQLAHLFPFGLPPLLLTPKHLHVFQAPLLLLFLQLPLLSLSALLLGRRTRGLFRAQAKGDLCQCHSVR